MTNQLSLQAESIKIEEEWTQDLLYWVKDLFHVYKTRYVETVALKDFNLKIYRGEIIAIMGPSGSGKTTLMNILSGLMLPTTGRVYFKKNPEEKKIINLSRLNLVERTRFRRENIGFVFQDYKLFDYLTTEENVQVPLLIQNMNPEDKKDNINEILIACGIEHRREYRIEQLSGGEKQRVQIAMALISSPQIILADEPTGNLDTENSIKIHQLLKNISKKYNATILIVSHDIKVHEFCDRVIELE